MRKTMLLMLFLGSLVLFTKPLVAQEKTVTGTVMGEKNLPLRDVTVLVKGTRIATKTDENGSFSIRATEKQTLIITSVNYLRQELFVGSRNNVSVQLVLAQQQMEEVVVVAMDTRKTAKEIPFAVQSVSGKELQESQR